MMYSWIRKWFESSNPGAHDMTKNSAKTTYSNFRAAMRGDWAHARPQDYPEWCKKVFHNRVPNGGIEWMARGTRGRLACAGRVGLF